MTTRPRPKNVIILDKDNPLVEVIGEFYWLEDHCALVSAAQAQSYQQGYDAGWHAAVCVPATRDGMVQVHGHRFQRLAQVIRTVVVRAAVLLLLMTLGCLLRWIS